MDIFDRKILSVLQTNSRQTAEKIGEIVGLSSAAVQKRIKKMRDAKIILKEIAVLDPAQLNQNVTVIVEVSLNQENKEVLDAFKKRMLHAPQVQQCYYTTGVADFIVIVVVKDMAEYTEFTHEYFFSSSQVNKFTSSVVMDRVKTELSIRVYD
ncbi:Lrp/AsnC family transcriptional regulator [Sneathiella marina]|uniref:Lrp/AsnC family transcriptional regulator n=1 Tax=Sneathiella marina TaxID=2950108 RepID=A0ABY4W5N3_9PROT|nr:Lrp/AsnC family transcriptional regulator [Sneathiella marina]USG62503.1 Lrp/AsnC family transcriptional regulator [Sneathiella marina]